MTFTSPNRTLIVVLGALAASGLFLFMFVLRGSKDSATETAAPVRPAPAVVTPAAGPKTKPGLAIAPNGLPTTVVREFRRHRIVVLALHAPKSEVAQLTLKEARAGAIRAGVGFVAVSVFDARRATALSSKLDTVADPVVFVLKRPEQVAIRLEGFNDRETVEQAARIAVSS